MKKTIIIFVVLLMIIFSTIGFLTNIQSQKKQIQKENIEYEYYLNKEIYGVDVATIINKAIESNKKNKVETDANNYYIDNKENSIKIELKMITIEKTYQMEEIANNDITNFVKYFNIIKFKCSKIEYHSKTGRVSKITFEQIEE